MKDVKYTILLIMAIIMLSFSSCVSTKECKNCKIEKVLDVVVKNENLYFMQVRFNRCTSKEMREILVKNELIDKYPTIKNRIIYVDEYLGKMYHEYRYEISIKEE